MDAKSLRELKPELDLFLDRYFPMFGREENFPHARSLMHGLLAGGDRRNVENIAETIDGGVVRTLQKFIAQNAWDDRVILRAVREHVVESLGDDDAVMIVDETGFPKKGTKSAGVARQYAGILGRVDNCQIGVFVDYCSRHGHVLCDRRLFLPEAWTKDRDRCTEAGIPRGVVFRTKPELAAEMIQNAVLQGMPFRWVTGDSVYGNSPAFVQTLRALEKWYVLDVSSETWVWTSEPNRRPLKKDPQAAGRPRKHKVALTKPEQVAALAANLPPTAWKRVTVAEGSQGPRVYEYAELTVWFSEERLPADRPERLLIRRSLGQDVELKFQRSNAPSTIPLRKLAEVGGCRWCVEMDFQCAKGECGLDEYETRGWIGWHHHTTLSLMALWFLTLQKLRLGKKTSPAHSARSSQCAPIPARPSPLGRKGNHPLVTTPATTQRPRENMSRRASQTRKTGITK
jgi:SRSO17 transposase